jgi:hypothetical protein
MAILERSNIACVKKSFVGGFLYEKADGKRPGERSTQEKHQSPYVHQ